MLAYCVLIGAGILSIVAVSQFAALVRFFPYNLSLTWAHYDFDQKGGGGWASYYNSIRLALLTSVVGTFVVFVGAYLVEKARGFALGRGLFHFLAGQAGEPAGKDGEHVVDDRTGRMNGIRVVWTRQELLHELERGEVEEGPLK